MSVTATDAYLAELQGMKLLAGLPRPKVPFVPEMIRGAFCLWRTNGNGTHVDNVRIDPTVNAPLTGILRQTRSSQLRVPGGGLLVRTVAEGVGKGEAELLDRLASSPRSTGCLMARSLEGVLDEPVPRLHDGHDFCVGTVPSGDAFLESRRLAARIFGRSWTDYDPEADFYNAPQTMTYVALEERGQVISTASVLVVDGIANVWSVVTDAAERGRGAASVVVHACLIEAYHQGARAAALGTSRDLARDGGLYHRLGFATVGQEYGWNIADVDRIELRA